MKSVSIQEIKLDPGFWTKTSQIQLFYGLWVNLCHLGIGLAFALPSVQVPQLSEDNSFIKVTRNEASWIASVFPLFSPIGCLISGYVTDWLGRRLMIIASQAPICVGWLCTGFAQSSKQVIIGRAITGIGSGMAMTPPRIFASEISLPNMRGVIGSFSTLAISIGISIQAGLGQFLDWPIICYICSIYTFTNFVSFFFLPETPYFVLKTKNVAAARVALTRFRARNYDFDKEMEEINEYKEDMDIRTISARERLTLLFTQASCKPFTLIVVFLFFTQITGTTSVMIWAVEMLTQSNSSIDAHTGNFLMSLTRLVGIVVTSILLFRVGRRPLALISALGVAVICFAIAMYISKYTEPSVVPLILYMTYMAFASVGYFTLPFLMASEVYPLQNRGLLGGITTTIGSLFIFCSLKITPFMMDNMGLTNTMLIYGICSLLGIIFIYIFLPETKNLTLQEIEEYYSDIRPSLVSQRENLSKLEVKSSTTNKTMPKTSADVINLASSIYKLDAKKTNRSKKNKKSSSALNLNAENKDAPRASVDTVLLQKIINLAKIVKGSKQNIVEQLKNNERHTESPLVIGKRKFEITEKPGTSKELPRTSSKTNILDAKQSRTSSKTNILDAKQSPEIEGKKMRKPSDESIKSSTSKKSKRDKNETSDSD